MVINGAIVSDLDMMFLESVLQEEISLCMMMRSARTGKYVLCHNKLSRGNQAPYNNRNRLESNN